jgi:hypothetical protein
MLSLFNVAFVLLILSLFDVALCLLDCQIVECYALFDRAKLVFFFSVVLLLDFGKVKVKCCKCAPVGAR